MSGVSDKKYSIYSHTFKVRLSEQIVSDRTIKYFIHREFVQAPFDGCLKFKRGSIKGTWFSSHLTKYHAIVKVEIGHEFNDTSIKVDLTTIMNFFTPFDRNFFTGEINGLEKAILNGKFTPIDLEDIAKYFIKPVWRYYLELALVLIMTVALAGALALLLIMSLKIPAIPSYIIFFLLMIIPPRITLNIWSKRQEKKATQMKNEFEQLSSMKQRPL